MMQKHMISLKHKESESVKVHKISVRKIIDGVSVIIIEGVKYCFYRDYIFVKNNNVHNKDVEKSYYEWCIEKDIVTLR